MEARLELATCVTAIARGAGPQRTGLVDHENAASEVLAIEHFNGFVGTILVTHRDEAKTA